MRGMFCNAFDEVRRVQNKFNNCISLKLFDGTLSYKQMFRYKEEDFGCWLIEKFSITLNNRFLVKFILSGIIIHNLLTKTHLNYAQET